MFFCNNCSLLNIFHFQLSVSYDGVQIKRCPLTFVVKGDHSKVKLLTKSANIKIGDSYEVKVWGWNSWVWIFIYLSIKLLLILNIQLFIFSLSLFQCLISTSNLFFLVNFCLIIVSAAWERHLSKMFHWSTHKGLSESKSKWPVASPADSFSPEN